jgi:anti-sigma regulatory factor (Ser/Thr protein kinase)
MVGPEPSSGIGPASMQAGRYWPRQDYLPLGALPSAVPSARLHARLIMAEWGFGTISETVELVVSELVTNGVNASRALGHRPPVWLGLSADDRLVLVVVWDGNPEPVRIPDSGDIEVPDLEAESGRGLLLVDSLSTHWGAYSLGSGHGKVVWSLVAVPEAPMPKQDQAVQALPKRTAADYPIQRPAHPMGDVEVLGRVRKGLKRLT